MIGALLSAALLCALLPAAADAAVLTTPEATGSADTVYVAGNPDWYPVEYYDQDTRTYEGILPELLELVGERAGLDFTYIQAGPEDRRRQLAENGQVELVSGCAADEAWLQDGGIHAGEPLLTAPAESGERQVCLAFTRIADDALIRRVEKAAAELPPQTISGLSIRLLMERPEKTGWRTAAACAAAALVLLLLAVVQAVRLHRYRKAAKQDPQVDPLTGIGNKACFTEFFDTFISDQYRSLYCVVYIGFDIARVNQYYSEAEAEEQLCFAANELKLSIRDNEAAARVSGGGFAVARPTSGEQEIQTWTGQLLERLNRYTERYGRDYRPDFRAGIYLLESGDRDCETALFNAREGYQQADSRDLPWAIVRSEHLERESERLQLKKQTLDAIRNREFQMFLQFIVRGKDGEICGAEAVSRWDHPQKGLLYPGSYIDLMETEGTIAELDFYIFEEVCRQLERWQKEGRPLLLSCNFSRITIGRKTFVQRVQEITERYAFDRSRLVMEITEDAMESSKEVAFANISQCKELGFRIALDDAGGGYTSFADLRDYPIDVVKIDRSILNAAVTRRGAALLRGITALVHYLEMAVLCEGAETQAQTELLREIGCDYIQGYYFYRPLPLKEADRVLAGQHR
jgi:EAL domain-containing protein (putative c-di-GMP-specific phosphodiesterase class I)/GGDEF domain-containing protein